VSDPSGVVCIHSWSHAPHVIDHSTVSSLIATG
jgi:hypothetical protein